MTSGDYVQACRTAWEHSLAVKTSKGHGIRVLTYEGRIDAKQTIVLEQGHRVLSAPRAAGPGYEGWWTA